MYNGSCLQSVFRRVICGGPVLSNAFWDLIASWPPALTGIQEMCSCIEEDVPNFVRVTQESVQNKIFTSMLCSVDKSTLIVGLAGKAAVHDGGCNVQHAASTFLV